ncbi:MMPL family transporter [Nocardioides lijunqiniae]|uniref:MMPL family transporter n=1 Tax=Nocardioides lijunqiniae TaxID=2760832 RepID=UPI001877F995|nr:MMPL family transporter [Nocardioides lijunqiniae]
MPQRLTRWSAPLVALVPLLVALAVIVLLGDGERAPGPADGLPEGYDGARSASLARDLPAGDDLAAVAFSSTGERLADAQVAELRGLADDLGAVASDDRPALVLADDGTAALAFVPLDASSPAEGVEAVTALRELLADRSPSGVDALVTGPTAVQADLEAVFDGANVLLLGVTAGVVALLLILTYRSPVLWVVPLVVVGVADRLAAVLATQTMAGLDIAFDDGTTGILSILVFGAGTDYALLLISRYRSELAVHESRYAAMAVALRRTAGAVLSSALTVVLGVLTLTLSLIPTTRGLGVASAIGIAVAAVFVLVVLPAALVCFGRWVFWPRIPRVTAPASSSQERGVWWRIGCAVARRPAAVATGSVALVALLSGGLLGVDVGLDEADQFIDTPEAVVAAERIGESFPAGVADPVRVLTRADGPEVLAAVEDVPGVESARLEAPGGPVAALEVVLDAPAGSGRAEDAVRALRSGLAAYPATYVTGTEADALDRADAGRRDLLVIIPLVVLLVLLVLGALLRSVVAPVVLVATVVATYAASLGAAWWLFTGVFGFAALDTNVPLFAFVFLVALGVDYNIFLVSRAREEAVEWGSRTGMLRALASTGGVITSAGVLLAAVFTVLGLLPSVALAQIGVVICLGVLLDTLLVRTVLVPALALMLGDRFWWPGSPGRGDPGADPADAVASPVLADLS